MNINMTLSQPSGSGMHASGRGRIASLRAFPIVSVPAAAAAGSKCVFVDVVTVPAYGRITDEAVLKGTFPGTSAWSPPI
jgi:hypothetical protein